MHVFDPLLDPPGRTDWAHVKALTEEEIAAAIANDPDADPTGIGDDWFDDATIHLPPPKKAISIRLDTEVLDWFKSLGPGYQTRINMILKGYMQRHRKPSGGPS